MAIAYGLIDFFVLSRKNNSPDIRQAIAKSSKTIADFANQSMARMSKMEKQPLQNNLQILISKIESDWDHDPFDRSSAPDTITVEVSPSVPVPDFIYSGYMHVGDILFAIINGVEYRTGEIIPENDYKVMNITPQKVVLEKNRGQVVIFLKDE
ncbi:hypothetical protein [Desulfobacula toluolica]|nr:hypothetical protein [Desulfobacula toluolica]